MYGVPVPGKLVFGSKGKQVKVLCDPVTVREEQSALCH